MYKSHIHFVKSFDSYAHFCVEVKNLERFITNLVADFFAQRLTFKQLLIYYNS